MNKMMQIIIANILILSSINVAAEGFEGDNISDIDLNDWTCEFCPELETWEVKLDTHLGFLEDEIFHYGNYSGLEDKTPLFFSGDINRRDKDGSYWKTSFQNLGLDSVGLKSAYGKQGSYELELNYQSTPVRKFDQLVTPFANPESSSLTLNNNWVPSDNGNNFNDASQFSPFSLSADWDRFGLTLDINNSDHFSYSTSYNRLKKQGVKEFSAAQIVNATYLPFSVDQITEDYDASISYLDEQWYASFTFKHSQFKNGINSVSYENPFISLVEGSEFGNLSAEPDNTSTTLSLNVRYNYAPRSFAQVRYSNSVLTQDQDFLPYTSNSNLLSPLPQANLDGEVITDDLSVRLRHKFSSSWSLNVKYRDRNRDNNTDQIIFQPVVTDTFVSSALQTLPYDFSKKSTLAHLDYRFLSNQLINLTYKSEERTRNFQSVSKTSENGYSIKYKATFFDDLLLTVKGEKFDRDSSELQLIDHLGVKENPLMQRFNVSDRQQDKVYLQLYYSPTEYFSMGLSGYMSEQDYHNTQIGLTDNQQDNINLDFSWVISEKVIMSWFWQQEEIQTGISGSNSFSTPDWRARNLDEVDSYGLNLIFKKLMDNNLDLLFDYSRSDADSSLTVTQNNIPDPFPNNGSLWSQAELKINYYYSESLDFSLGYQYQEFESNDYSIDGVTPGTLTHLLTFGALSHNYDVNYVSLSMGYRF